MQNHFGWMDDVADLLPTQYADFRQPREPRPERKLMLAIFDDTIKCLASDNEKLRTEARRWVSGLPALITFDTACAEIGVNPDSLGPALLSLADRPAPVALARRSPAGIS